ncbi:helix-turn-helix transcriptional regulator [Halostella litorea]|uniref:helix-turn-helix transcriptional regulator n=1 Tax=Halostella litorea TaxID=2528831 RepID=UPI001091EDED|nr:hypothetical protein [Halostella litorea]
MNRAHGVGVALLVCLAGVHGVAAVGAAGVDAPDPTAEPGALAPDPMGVDAQGFDYTEFRVQVAKNGSARWTFHYERRLTNESERREFRAFASEFEANETELYAGFRERARALAAAGENATDRTMRAKAFSRRAEVDEELGTDTSTGVVEMSFTWTGFAATDGDRVVVGDVFDGGLYVGPDQALVLVAGEGLAFAAVSPDGEQSAGTLADSDTVTWRGERRFTDNRPRAVLEPPALATETTTDDGSTSPGDGTDGTGTTDAGDPSDAGDESSTDGLLPMVGVVVLLVAGVVAAVALGRGDALFDRGGTDVDDGDGDGGTPGAAGDADGGTDAAAEPAVDEAEMLSDEDRVVALLEENGGRMKQVNIVEETEWSKSKVSMLLSEMDEEGTISKLRVGRENIISLEGNEPAAAGSPFDEE